MLRRYEQHIVHSFSWNLHACEEQTLCINISVDFQG
jgi:hypothetical protein